MTDFDSPSIFASLLGKHKGGFYRVSVGIPLGGECEPDPHSMQMKQMYHPDTNVLV